MIVGAKRGVRIFSDAYDALDVLSVCGTAIVIDLSEIRRILST
jgi:hypothetical protein